MPPHQSARARVSRRGRARGVSVLGRGSPGTEEEAPAPRTPRDDGGGDGAAPPRSLQTGRPGTSRGDFGGGAIAPQSTAETVMFAAGVAFLILLGFGPHIARRCGCVPRRDVVRAARRPPESEGAEEEEENASRAGKRMEAIEAHLVSQEVISHDGAICRKGRGNGLPDFANETDSATQPRHGSAEGGPESDGDEGAPITCGICLEDFRIGDFAAWSLSSACDHAFHRCCVTEWLTKHDDCPTCRSAWLPAEKTAAAEEAPGAEAGMDSFDGADDDNGVGESGGCTGDSMRKRFCVLHGIFTEVPGRCKVHRVESSHFVDNNVMHK